MRLFSRLYDTVLRWAEHRHAARYLVALSFAESSFFPIPPDVMLAPMTLARPHRGWHFAMLTTISSVAGGLAGYLIGWVAIDAITPWLASAGYAEAYERARSWFDEWGIWAIFVAGFTPIPFKVFTIAAGALQMFLPGFVVGSAIGRGARFYLVAGLIMIGGPRMAEGLRRYVDTIGWVTVAIVIIAFIILQWT
jgi:membrane protein YqaA with SNARE-associated domain